MTMGSGCGHSRPCSVRGIIGSRPLLVPFARAEPTRASHGRMSVIHSVKTTRGLLAAMFAVAVLGTAGFAVAGDALSGDKIRSTMSDTTVEGTMSDGTAYSEF